jgi:photosystem II stability/assembly factor-like uncharacterized protein
MFAGRISDVAGVPGEPDILYVGASSSGLFKSTNGGITFESIFDDANTFSIGAIALEPGDPEVVWVGTGEGAVRNSISYGDGIYKSTDGGDSWSHMGLEDSERFSRIVVHPRDPDIVFAAAMGHAWGPNEQRGVFRTTDGGESWERVLFTNETSGASDVAIDPLDPDIVYAGMHDYLRQPWYFRSGGPGSGLFRSSDGGATWTKLTDPVLDNGLPGAELIGRVGVSVHEADPRIVYALVESQEPGQMWRSEDRGITWQMVSDNRRINNRPFYYTQVRADPVDPDRVYTLAGSFNVSTDGGQTFGGTGGSMFGDHHALWIDPTDPGRLLSGTDGGFWISNDFGRNWDFINNMPMAQAYHVGIDMAEPYNVLGGFQDHEIWRGPNEKWNQRGVREGDWVRLRYMADGMYALPDPRDPDIIYYNGHFGDITRIDMANADERYIQPYPPGPNGGGADLEEYRFHWNSPVHISSSNPDVIYYGGNVLFKTQDGGESWEIISPDLTTDDPEKQRISGGPISLDNTRAEFHCTILSISESPLDPRVLWAGTDDGNLQLSRDGGSSWANVAPNIQGAPPFSWFASVQASNADPGTAYVAIDQHRMDDFEPHAFVTHDFGETWENISEGLRGYVHIVMEDPRQPNLLYAGTEVGIFVSFDRGESWTDLRLGLPPLAVVDMKVHPRDNDLVLGTHARGFYILDDITPLQELAAAMAQARPALFDPMPAVRYIPASDVSVIGNRVWVARNQPYGVILSYWIPTETPDSPEGVNALEAEASTATATIEIFDADGQVLRTMTAPARPGLNRSVWNLAEASSCAVEEAASTPQPAFGGRGRFGGIDRGTWVRAIPGEYTVRLTVAGTVLETTARVRQDPNVTSSPADMEAWLAEARTIEAMECMARRASFQVRALDGELAALTQSAPSEEIRTQAQAVRDQLRPTFLVFAGDARDPGHVNLPGRINWLTIQVGNYPGRPTSAQTEWIDRYSRMAQEHQARLEEIRSGPLAELNDRLREAGLEEIGGS